MGKHVPYIQRPFVGWRGQVVPMGVMDLLAGKWGAEIAAMVRDNPPRLVRFFASVSVIVDPEALPFVKVYCGNPGERMVRIVECNARAVSALRKLFKNPRREWFHVKHGERCIEFVLPVRARVEKSF